MMMEASRIVPALPVLSERRNAATRAFVGCSPSGCHPAWLTSPEPFPLDGIIISYHIIQYSRIRIALASSAISCCATYSIRSIYKICNNLSDQVRAELSYVSPLKGRTKQKQATLRMKHYFPELLILPTLCAHNLLITYHPQ